MAYVKFIATRGQSGGGMHGSMEYCKREQKTWDEETRRHLVTGVNCMADTAFQEFMNTKRLYGKTDGRMYYHVIQSFRPDEQISPATAHEIGLKLAQEFAGHEVLVCTHTDRDHLHSHLVINSVSAETGRKYHSDKDNIQRIRQASDNLCREYGLTVIQPKQKRTPGMSAAEYRSADRGQSWKMRLAIAIDDAMSIAKSRTHFIDLMEQEGYQVSWSDSRKYITYTTPEGKRCRDIKLHEAKYLKENLELEFRIRKQILWGVKATSQTEHGHGSQNRAGISGIRTELDRPSEISGWDSGNAGAVFTADVNPLHERRIGENAGPTAANDGDIYQRSEAADGRIPRFHPDSGEWSYATGWESERRILQSNLQRGGAHEQMEQETDLDLHDTFDGADLVGAGALDLVRNLSRIKSSSDDPEERKREQDAQRAADNLAVAIGVTVAAASILMEQNDQTIEEQTL